MCPKTTVSSTSCGLPEVEFRDRCQETVKSSRDRTLVRKLSARNRLRESRGFFALSAYSKVVFEEIVRSKIQEMSTKRLQELEVRLVLTLKLLIRVLGEASRQTRRQLGANIIEARIIMLCRAPKVLNI